MILLRYGDINPDSFMNIWIYNVRARCFLIVQAARLIYCNPETNKNCLV